MLRHGRLCEWQHVDNFTAYALALISQQLKNF